MHCLIAKITLDSIYGSVDESGIKRMCHKLRQNFPITIKSIMSRNELEEHSIVICSLAHEQSSLPPLLERIAAFIEKDGSIRTATMAHCVRDIDWYIAQDAKNL